MAEILKIESFKTPEESALAAELRKLQKEYYHAQSEAGNGAAYAERVRHTKVFEANLRAKGFNPDNFYLWHLLVGSSVSADMDIAFMDTPEKDIEQFIRQEFSH